MANYYTTYATKSTEEFNKRESAKEKLLEVIKTPIKYDIYPTVITSNTDKFIEDKLYNERQQYTNAPLRQGDYTYRGYNADSVYSSLYQKIFMLNKALWEVEPKTLATAYLELFEEFELFEQWGVTAGDFHYGTDDLSSKVRITARKCGIDMTSGLEIANGHGFWRGMNTHTGGSGSYSKKADFKVYAEDVKRELQRGDKAFDVTNDKYGVTLRIRDILPCMYTMLNLFCGMYRDIFNYRYAKNVTAGTTPQFTKASGFDEYKYRQNGGQNFEMGWLCIAGGVFMALVMSSSPMAVVLFALPAIGIGILNVVLGWNSQ